MDIFDMITGIIGDIEDCDETAGLLKDRPDFSGINDGDEFEFCGIKFIRLGIEQGGVLCVTKDDIGEMKFHQRGNNNYKESEIRQKLLNDFLPRLGDADLLPYEMDLIADNGETDFGVCTDFVGLLTYDLYRKYRRFILPVRGYIWTCTPYSCSPDYPYVRVVNSSGYVYYDCANYTYRCRPVCIFAI